MIAEDQTLETMRLPMMWYDNRYRFLEKFVVVSILVDRQALYRNNQCDGHARQSLSIPRQRAKHKQLNMIPVNDREIDCNTCFSSTRWHTPASDVYSCRPRVIFYGLQAQFPSSLLVLCFLGLECNLLLYFIDCAMIDSKGVFFLREVDPASTVVCWRH